MFWIIFIIGTVVLLIFWGIRDSNEDTKSNVSNYGGMQKKYNILIEYFMRHPSSRITWLTGNHVTISSSAMMVDIDYVLGKVEISLKGTLPLLGNISKSWKYPDGYSQDLMIQEIDNFLVWNMQQMQRIASKMNDI